MSQASKDKNRLVRNTLVLYLRMAFQMGVFLYTSRLVLNMLGIDDYGIYDVVAGIVVLLSFLNNSLTTCTQRFITFALGKDDLPHLCEVYSISISIHVLMAALVLLFGETVGLWYVLTQLVYPVEKLWSVIVCYQCSLLMGMLLIVSIPYNALIIAHERMTAFAGITIMDVCLKLAAASALCFFADGKRLIPYAVMMVVVATITRTSYSIYCRKAFPHVKFHFCHNRALIRQMLSFAGWSTFGNASIACNTQGLNLVLNAVGGPAVNAARGVAFQVQMAVTQFVSSFQTAINPQITKNYSCGDLVQMRQLVLRSSRLSFMLILLITVPLLLATPWVLELWLHTVPNHAVDFMRLMILVSMVDAIANPMMVAAAATGRIRKYHTTIGSILLLTLPVSLLCVVYMHMPVETVFVVLLAMTILAQCVRMVLCRELFGLSIKTFIQQVIWRVLAVSVISITPFAWVFMGVTDIGQAILSCCAAELWLAIVIATIGLQAEERKFILRKIKLIR